MLRNQAAAIVSAVGNLAACFGYASDKPACDLRELRMYGLRLHKAKLRSGIRPDQLAIAALFLGVIGCSDAVAPQPGPGAPSGPGTPAPNPSAPTQPSDRAFETASSTSRFLSQSTFGATRAEIETLTGASASAWFEAELAKPATLTLPQTLSVLSQPSARRPDGSFTFAAANTPSDAFLRNMLSADDQLRQRMAFALSEILVISHRESDMLFTFPRSVSHYMDILIANAFGNYRDLLEDVTYSPAMAHYLTYLQNERGNPASGRVPDENYAREIMQLFTIGLVELQNNGELRLDAGGNPIETYDIADITGLARVFTGLSYNDPNFFFDFAALDDEDYYSPLIVFPSFHSSLEKSFLGATIPAGTSGTESIGRALDTLMAHPNTPPFVSRQLIQRFVTSHPSPDYVDRVATAFANGTFRLPNGNAVGDGRRGDLAATLAAVLMDPEARNSTPSEPNRFGKIREPLMRFVHWARAFQVSSIEPENTNVLFNTSSPNALSQHPFKAASVFNFFRPGYVAPGTQTGAAQLTMPELQIVNANSVGGYINFMMLFINESIAGGDGTFIPDYSAEIALASDPDALIDHLVLVLNHGRISQQIRQGIFDAISAQPLTTGGPNEAAERRARVHLAILMMMTAPDYIVQR